MNNKMSFEQEKKALASYLLGIVNNKVYNLMNSTENYHNYYAVYVNSILSEENYTLSYQDGHLYLADDNTGVWIKTKPTMDIANNVLIKYHEGREKTVINLDMSSRDIVINHKEYSGKKLLRENIL